MGVVQHTSVQTTAQNPSVTLPSPVTAGNLIVAVIGYNKFNSIQGFSHDGNPSTSFGLLTSSPGYPNGSYNLDAYMQLALLSESYTLTVDFTSNDGAAKHVHIFEVSGYDTFDLQNINQQTSTSTPSVSVTSNTSRAQEFVLAAFLDETHPGTTFTVGSSYSAGETTNSTGFSMFTEYKEISSISEPSASVTAASSVYNSLIVTFYNSGSGGGGGTGNSTTFLGSVRVIGSAPTNIPYVPFLGSVKVVQSAPAGESNPYLGSVVLGSPSASDTNPALGEVVVVTQVPAGAVDVFLGAIEES